MTRGFSASKNEMDLLPSSICAKKKQLEVMQAQHVPRLLQMVPMIVQWSIAIKS